MDGRIGAALVLMGFALLAVTFMRIPLIMEIPIFVVVIGISIFVMKRCPVMKCEVSDDKCFPLTPDAVEIRQSGGDANLPVDKEKEKFERFVESLEYNNPRSLDEYIDNFLDRYGNGFNSPENKWRLDFLIRRLKEIKITGIRNEIIEMLNKRKNRNSVD